MVIFRLVLGICLVVYVVVIKRDNDMLREHNRLLKEDNIKLINHIIEEATKL